MKVIIGLIILFIICIAIIRWMNKKRLPKTVDIDLMETNLK